VVHSIPFRERSGVSRADLIEVLVGYETDPAFPRRPAVTSSSLAPIIADRLRESRALITGRWLAQIAARVNVEPQMIFPTDDLLDHMPLLVDGIAGFLDNPTDTIPADAQIVHHARELGGLRYQQGFSEYEILKEFELLGGILFSFTMRVVGERASDAAPQEAIACASRIFKAVALLQQATTTRFLELAKDRISEREGRLRAFHRALTHEMRNRIGATLGAGQLLQDLDVGPEERARLTGVVVRNADSMRLVLENLLELSRLDTETRQQRHVPLGSAIREAVRQLRDMAATNYVEVRVPPHIPLVEVNAAAVELCLANLLSNGIKYADEAQPNRWVLVSADAVADPSGAPIEVVVTVEDNGIGIPAHAHEHLFQRFFRAHDATHPSVEGTGLGLSLVREVVETIGGRVWIEQTAVGTRISFAVPCRRASDFTGDGSLRFSAGMTSRTAPNSTQ
jgi:signal transduction histidine kinase